MKNSKSIQLMLLLMIVSAAISCKKEKDPVTSNPRQTVLDSIQRDFTEVISDGSPGAYAVGYDFWVTENGVINQLVLCTPSIGVYKIIVKNMDTEATDSVSVNIAASDTGRSIYKSITPMTANAGDYCRVTFNDLDKPQYQYLRTNGMSQVYGNISLRWYVYQAQATSSSINGPYGHSQDYTFGGVGVTFVKD